MVLNSSVIVAIHLRELGHEKLIARIEAAEVTGEDFSGGCQASSGVKIFLYFIGKPRDQSANSIATEFIKRSTRYAECEMREIDPRKFDILGRHTSARKIFLDPAGKTLDSSGFIDMVRTAESESRDLVFLLGGHDGLPAEWKPKADLLLSLSAMTFPHELARAMLAEQIYRAFTTLRGHPYPR